MGGPGGSRGPRLLRGDQGVRKLSDLEHSAAGGEFVTDILDYDDGRAVSVYVPAATPEAIVYAADGQVYAPWGQLTAAVLPTMIVGVHGLSDESARLAEYSPVFDADRFGAHAAFFVDVVRAWVAERFGVSLSAGRTAVLGYSAGGELALALGLTRPDVYGAVLAGSPGGGFVPGAALPTVLPRTLLFAGTREPFFHENATRWATALRDAGAEVTMREREASHGSTAWRGDFAEMVSWAFER